MSICCGDRMGLEPLSGRLAGLRGTHSKPPARWQRGGPQALAALPMVKAETHFQADPVSREVARPVAGDPEEWEDGECER